MQKVSLNMVNGGLELQQSVNEVSSQLAEKATDSIVHANRLGASPSASATANTNAIQQALDLGGHVIIGKAGTYFINQTLLIGSNTKLELGQGVVLKQATAMSSNMIKNKDTVNGNVNIAICGGKWDYDEQQQGVINSFKRHAIVLQKVVGIELKNINIVNVRKYAVLLADCKNFVIDTLDFDTISDGVHLMGPIEGGDVRNLRGTTGDDMLAFTIGDYSTYEISRGNITNVSVDGVYPVNSLNAVKFAGNTGYYIDDINIKNLRGSTTSNGIISMDDMDLVNTEVRRLVVENVSLDCPNGKVFHFRAPIHGDITIRNVKEVGSAQLLAVAAVSKIKTMMLDGFECLKGLNVFSMLNDGEIENLFVRNTSLVKTVGAVDAGLFKNQGVLKKIAVDQVSLTGGYALLFDNKAENVSIAQMSNLFLADGNHGVIAKSNMHLSLTNVHAVTTADVVVALDAASTIRVLASNIVRTNGGGRFITRYNAGKISANGQMIKADITHLTAPQTGDTIYNTNGALSCGTGVCMWNSQNWKNLWSGATY